MKKIANNLTKLMAGMLACLLLACCASTRIKSLSGPDFINQAQQIEQINSFYWVTYLGASNRRAYLEYAYPAFIGGGSRVTVFWTPLSELPDDVTQKLKAGTPPWKPWNVKKEQVERTMLK